MATYPYEVGFPVKFYSGGDTTKEAFGKHIQEIERIYGILNRLNADKISASEFTTKLNAHINDSNPHPNLDLGNTKGSIPFSRVSGDLDLSRTTGNLDTSRVTGNFPSSRITGNFDTSRINGLADYIKTQSSGVTNESVSENGYIKFGNGLVIQWGVAITTNSSGDPGTHDITFTKPFDIRCFFVIAGLSNSDGNIPGYVTTVNITLKKFDFIAIRPDGKGFATVPNQPVGWIAFGR